MCTKPILCKLYGKFKKENEKVHNFALGLPYKDTLLNTVHLQT